MGAHRYDPAIMKTQVGETLYIKWLRLHVKECCPEFEDFMNFYNWAMESGYTYGDSLYRIDTKAPFTPDNCAWKKEPDTIKGCISKAKRYNDQKRIDSWNNLVNSIRKAQGMEPLQATKKENEDG